MKSHGSVVCRRATGLGDCLVSLLPAWNYAEATSRNLVIDWRHSPYALSPEQDAFELFFDPVRSFGEIYRELSSLDEYEAADYFPPAPRQTFPERHPDDQFRTKVIKILRQLRDIDDKVLLCDFCLHDALPDRVRCRELLDRLYLRPHWKRIMHEQYEAFFSGQSIIGLHLRRGDESNANDHDRFWRHPARALSEIKKAISALRSELDAETTVFLSTDSRALEHIVLDWIPGSFTRQRWRPVNDRETMHDFGNGWRNVADAVIDMYLLKECNAIVRYPPNSFFSFWADVSQTERGVLTDGTIRSDQNAYDLLLPAIAWTP